MQGVVYKSTGSWYLVKDQDGKFWNARMKGIFKLDDITSTNPIAVGDIVDFVTENEGENSVMINKIHDRKNYINRQSPKIKSQNHIVAANVDQSIMIATLKEPRTSQGFIDRFLVACEMYHVPASVVFNKSDIYKQKELDKYAELEDMYQSIGYHVYLVSIKEGVGIEELKEKLKGKTTLVSGHSGVGKSSFINAVFPEKIGRAHV